MAYKHEILDNYRLDALAGKPFTCATCPYCNGQRDASVKYIHPSTKPNTPWGFWNHVILKKYRLAQSKAARRNAAMCVLGPMVDQSELPFRMLCRAHGATLAYTPMLHAKSFSESTTYRQRFWTTTPLEVVRHSLASAAETEIKTDAAGPRGSAAGCEEGANQDLLIDRPCIVQFCGHDPDTILKAARLAVRGECVEANSKSGSCDGVANPLQGYRTLVKGSGEDEVELYYQCDAVDINLGCPQGIARRGHYGSFLMEDWDLIHTIIHTLHVELEVPVTAKIRVFDHSDTTNSTTAGANSEVKFDELLTIYYAQMIRDAGAQVLCVHGRTRAMKGQSSGLANLELIRRVRLALGGSIPVISNGNVLCYQDVLKNLEQTGCEGHMCAEPLLWDPTLFSDPVHPVFSGRLHGANKKARLAALNTALDYMRWLRRYPVDIGMAKAHLFKMCYHSYELHTSFRDTLSNLKSSMNMNGGDATSAIDASQEVCCFFEENPEGGGEMMQKEGTNDFISQVEAIEDHLQALVKAELSCDVEEEQPKTAKEKKAESRIQQIDIFEEEDHLGLDF